MTKLLNKPLRSYSRFSFIILVISIPVYFFTIEFIWKGELDEHNEQSLHHIQAVVALPQFENFDPDSTSRLLSTLLPGVAIVPYNDSLPFTTRTYETSRPGYKVDDAAEDRFRGLQSEISIQNKLYIVSIETNIEEADETLVAIAVVTLIFFLALFAGFIVINRSISRKMWAPFYNTLHKVKQFELAKTETLKFEATEIEEFSDLNKAIEQLTSASITSFKQQKIFVENASHELQTPIALLKTKIDLLLQQDRISAETERLIEQIEAPLNRLTHINKNLLLLFKVENRHFVELEDISVQQLLNDTVDMFDVFAVEKDLHISVDAKNDFSVQANRFLIETLFNNLISNCIRHATEKSEIQILVRGKSITFMNVGGEEITSKNMFKRFGMDAKSTSGSRLGLAIVHEIVVQNNWSIDYRFENDHHIFTLEM